MRIGSNPAKFDNHLASDCYHRVIVPVYIPNHTGYFEHQFTIFKWCLESLIHTVHTKCRVTIYINGCAADVIAYIMEAKSKSPHIIDQVFLSDVNLGKINAILASTKGNIEPIITITDADVLFKHGWIQATESILHAYPEAGMVAPVPSSKSLRYYTAANWAYACTQGKVFLRPVKDPLGMKRFSDSLQQQSNYYSDEHLKHYVTMANSDGTEAAFGCGHFVVSMRREVFDKGSNEPAFVKIQGGVEAKFIDSPNQNLGFLRLATLENYAYHMGNVPEEWMKDEYTEIVSKKPDNITLSSLPVARNIPFWLIFIFSKIIHRKPLFRVLLRWFKLDLSPTYY